MGGTTLAPTRERQRVEAGIAATQDSALAYLGEHPGAALGELLLHLAAPPATRSMVSRALSELLAADKIEVGSDHTVRLTGR